MLRPFREAYLTCRALLATGAPQLLNCAQHLFPARLFARRSRTSVPLCCVCRVWAVITVLALQPPAKPPMRAACRGQPTHRLTEGRPSSISNRCTIASSIDRSSPPAKTRRSHERRLLQVFSHRTADTASAGASPSSSPPAATRWRPRAASMRRWATCRRTTGGGTPTTPSRALTGWATRWGCCCRLTNRKAANLWMDD